VGALVVWASVTTPLVNRTIDIRIRISERARVRRTYLFVNFKIEPYGSKLTSPKRYYDFPYTLPTNVSETKRRRPAFT